MTTGADAHGMAHLERVAALFDIPGKLVAVAPLGSGHINDTYLLTHEHGGQQRNTVLQRINTHVFPDPAAVMQNMERVLTHLHGKLPSRGTGRHVLTLVPSREGASHVRDDAGEWWRATWFVPETHTVDFPETEAQAFQAAHAFGGFLRQLADLQPPPLHTTVPGFHDTWSRLAALVVAADADPRNRAAGCTEEIRCCLDRRELPESFAKSASNGALPERVTHNDTKVNNVLLDDRSGEALCVIDLDTVMPGLAPLDFGDLVRSAASSTTEDAVGAAAAAVRLSYFEAVTRGYLRGAAGCLLPAEIASLVTASQVITLECGVRFLTDHLLGDRYFRIHRPGQNLDRARCQLSLLGSLERRETELQAIVTRVAAHVADTEGRR